jgi:hypothetical protein
MTAIEPAQRTAGKIAGFLYLLTNLTAIFGYAVRGQLIARGDVVQTARNILGSERLFRISIVSDLLTVACVLLLVLALYVVLKPVNRYVTLLATLWRLAENFVLAVVPLSGFVIVALLSHADSLQAFDMKQVSTLVSALYRVWGAGFNIGFVFLGLGSAVFSYLWLKSRYIPRALAAWGIFSSLLLALASFAIMVFPGLATVGLAYMAPMGIYEFGLGLWLVVKGLQEPAGE